MLGFMLVGKLRDGHPTLLGLVTGMVSGLVGITPSADAVSPLGALFVGFLSAMAAAWAITWKRKHRIDDSLDVFAVHGIAGIVGAMFVVFFGSASAPSQTAGVFFGGDPGLIWREIVAITVTLVYVAVAYTERLADAGIRPSVGSVGDSYDNALAETVNGLYKTELIYSQPRESAGLTEVEFATMNWVHWWNTGRLHEGLGHRTPAEVEAEHFETVARQVDTLTAV